MSNQIDMIITASAMWRGISRNEQPAPGGIAISGERIVAVGTPEQIESLAGPETIIRRYGEDRLLMPALCDAHLHLENTILCESGPELRYVDSEAECVSNCKAWHDDNPDSYWIIGFGWHQANWPDCKVPDKKLLSEALPNNPAFLLDIDTHCAWLNQKALDELEISRETPDPIGGRIWRDESGEPTGYLEESAALNIEPTVLKRAISDPAIRAEKLLETIRLLNRRGVTEIWDAFDTPESWYEALEDLKNAGKLNLRVNTCALINDNTEFIQTADRLSKRYPNIDDPITFWGFKVIGDGVGGAHTAWMTEPYADNPDTCGNCLLNPEDFRKRILACEKTGRPVHVHACGSKTVEYALDCFEEAARAGYIRSQRNCITHCDTVNPKDFPRFRQLGIVAALQPDMLAPTPTYATDFYRKTFGEEVYANAWANRSMFDNCDYISFSSDSPVGFAGKLDQVFRATQRTFNDGLPAGGIHPEQKISISEALWAFTWGGSYQLYKESIKGSLEVGKYADVAVFDHNLFTCDPAEIRDTESLLTLIYGRIAYDAEA